jgi:hypothetical protein
VLLGVISIAQALRKHFIGAGFLELFEIVVD